MAGASDSPSSGRALVLVGSPEFEAKQHARPQGPARNAASFVAQLIAAAQKLPQTRERRRADPTEAIAAYQSAIARLRKLNAQ